MSGKPDPDPATGAEQPGEDERARFLARCTEAGRLERARKLAAKVTFQLDDAELVIAAVGNYNVVIDAVARRIQHGCRDFHGQSSARRLCKHVAATLLALDEEKALPIAQGLAEAAEAPAVGVVPEWRFEVINRFTPGR